ncbi:MAG: hypothetical protein GY711_10320 [bacterium]|nr:hypothetical protein [bacterium]
MKTCLPALAAILVLAPPAIGQWTTASLSQARSRLTGTSDGTRAYFAGGWVGLSNYSSVVDIYDPITGAWSTASLSVPRADIDATSANGIVFFAGGRNAHGPSAVVDVYDSASGVWTAQALSQPRVWLAATSVDSRVFFAGGRAPSPPLTSDVVDIYNVTTGNWSMASLSQARSGLAATSTDELAFFAGGSGSSRIDVYSSTTDTWSTRELVTPRLRHAAAIVHDQFLVAGGYTTAVDILDLSSGSWTVNSIPQQRVDCVAAVVGHRVAFASGTSSGSVDLYDATTRTWSTDALSVARSSLAAASVGGQALFAGGKSGGSTFHDRVDLYEPELGTRYCSPAVPNSTGLPARISADGSPFVDDDELTLVAEHLPHGEFGYFLVGANQGAFQPPGSQGVLCLACGFQGCSGIGRFNQAGLIVQGPSGSIAVDLAALPTTPATAVQPGDTWNFQCWFRDQGTSNFTDAISIPFF